MENSAGILKVVIPDFFDAVFKLFRLKSFDESLYGRLKKVDLSRIMSKRSLVRG